jgi:hypothetical protein
VFARIEAEGRCSEKQLKAIRALYIDGMSATEFASLEGVDTQAICDRMNRLANKATPVYRWWRQINQGRRRFEKPSDRFDDSEDRMNPD